MPAPYALLRSGFPFHATLGMRRVTTYCMDIAIGDGGALYVLCRTDGQGGNIRLTNWDDEDLGTIGDGKFVWPVTMLRDGQGNLYVSDEGSHKIIALAPDGTSVDEWGRHGSDPGELDRPSGMAFDADENLYVVDTMNHRVQKFTKDGKLISAFGSHGRGPGEFDMPWGVAVDDEGFVYVSDWRNDRVQKLTTEGEFVMQFGRSGSGEGELSRPAGVAVDQHCDVFVADRGNHRVMQFDHTGRYVDRFIGDATLSKSGRAYVIANPKALRAREMTSLEQAKRLRGPCSVRFDGDLMYIPDFGSHRIQVYRKEAEVLAQEDIWAEPRSPFLYTV